MSAASVATTLSSRFTPATLVGVTEEDTFPVSRHESRKQIQQKFERAHLSPILSSASPIAFFCVNNHVVARLQQGPTCGLVSLRMAAESVIRRGLSSQPDGANGATILETARSMGMTGYGEMFDAQAMAQLAEKCYSPLIRSLCWTDPWDGTFIRTLLEEICSGSILLVPYDVDKNHEPCMSGGKKAHWAAVKGFLVPLFTPLQLEYCKSLCTASENCTIETVGGLPLVLFDHHSPSLSDDDFTGPQSSPKKSNDRVLDIAKIVDLSNMEQVEKHLRIVTQQSKSKHQAVWTFTSLKDSNHNLMQFDESRVTEEDFKVPSELSSLRGKAVFVSRPN